MKIPDLYWILHGFIGFDHWKIRNLNQLLYRIHPLVNVNKKSMENHHFWMGKSTISTGPFSSSKTVSLPGRVTCQFCPSFVPVYVRNPTTVVCQYEARMIWLMLWTSSFIVTFSILGWSTMTWIYGTSRILRGWTGWNHEVMSFWIRWEMMGIWRWHLRQSYILRMAFTLFTSVYFCLQWALIHWFWIL